MVEEHEVALLHRAQVVARLEVPNPVPDRALVTHERVERVLVRLALREPVSRRHGATVPRRPRTQSKSRSVTSKTIGQWSLRWWYASGSASPTAEQPSSRHSPSTDSRAFSASRIVLVVIAKSSSDPRPS